MFSVAQNRQTNRFIVFIVDFDIKLPKFCEIIGYSTKNVELYSETFQQIYF